MMPSFVELMKKETTLREQEGCSPKSFNAAPSISDKIHAFMKKQAKPVTTATIANAVGVSIAYANANIAFLMEQEPPMAKREKVTRGRAYLYSAL